MASMGIVSLLQMGIVKHLPDPPTRRPHFHSDKVNSSNEAYGYGMPDGPLTLAAHAANIVLAAAGPPERSQDRPWIPLLARMIPGTQAAVAAKYLRSEERSVGKACVSTCRFWWSPFN